MIHFAIQTTTAVDRSVNRNPNGDQCIFDYWMPTAAAAAAAAAAAQCEIIHYRFPIKKIENVPTHKRGRTDGLAAAAARIDSSVGRNKIPSFSCLHCSIMRNDSCCWRAQLVRSEVPSSSSSSSSFSFSFYLLPFLIIYLRLFLKLKNKK